MIHRAVIALAILGGAALLARPMPLQAMQAQSTPVPGSATCLRGISAQAGGPNSLTGMTVSVDISYTAGWNMIAVVTSDVIGRDVSAYAALSGPFYWLVDAPGPPRYDMEQSLFGQKIVWAYLPAPVTIHATGRVPNTIGWGNDTGLVMIGNTTPINAKVVGVDVAYSYDPRTGYFPVTELKPGQAAFAYAPPGCAVGLLPEINP